MAKKKLQDTFPELKFGTVKECLEILNWTYQENENKYNDIKCDCGAEIKFCGWVGTELAYCPKCEKGMQDMTGILPASNVTAGILNFDEYDLTDERVWTPKNIWGWK